jgi:hypothetical protein
MLVLRKSEKECWRSIILAKAHKVHVDNEEVLWKGLTTQCIVIEIAQV